MSDSKEKDSSQHFDNKRPEAPISPIAKQVRFCDSSCFNETNRERVAVLTSQIPKSNSQKNDK